MISLASSHVSADTDRIADSDQRGWNAGYLAGEAERVALATANSELRSEIRAVRLAVTELREAIAYELNRFL